MSTPKPILTVKLSSVNIGTGVGPNMETTIQVADGPSIGRIGNGSTGKFLFQKPYSSSSAKVTVTITEKDPVTDDPGKGDKTLSIDLSNPPKQGSDNLDVKVTAKGGDKGKTATSSFGFTWYVSTNVDDVINYIQGEMTKNAGSSAFQEIRDINDKIHSTIRRDKNSASIFFGELANIKDVGNAAGKFANLVKKGGVWDYKSEIKDRQKFGEWSFDRKTGVLFPFDLWGNLHYGYIGLAAGFSEDLLLEAAGLVQVLDAGGDMKPAIDAFFEGQAKKYDDPKDQIAIRVGIRLWKDFGTSVTKDNILRRIRINKEGLGVKDAPEGIAPKSFLQ